MIMLNIFYRNIYMLAYDSPANIHKIIYNILRNISWHFVFTDMVSINAAFLHTRKPPRRKHHVPVHGVPSTAIIVTKLR